MAVAITQGNGKGKGKRQLRGSPPLKMQACPNIVPRLTSPIIF